MNTMQKKKKNVATMTGCLKKKNFHALGTQKREIGETTHYLFKLFYVKRFEVNKLNYPDERLKIINSSRRKNHPQRQFLFD